jgi:hypothetical protein
MTTPSGTPSVRPSPHDLQEQMYQPGEAQIQASAKGGGQYTGSGEPAPRIIGDVMTDVHSRFGDGATVSGDQSELEVTSPVAADGADSGGVGVTS